MGYKIWLNYLSIQVLKSTSDHFILVVIDGFFQNNIHKSKESVAPQQERVNVILVILLRDAIILIR